MKNDELNTLIRTLFEQLIEEGYNKSSICSSTLGSQSLPVFITMLKGTDLGHKPLTRILDSLGFELHIVPVEKTDKEFIEAIDKKTIEFIDNAKTDLSNFLSNKSGIRPTTRSTGTSKLIDDKVIDILKDIL